MKIFIKIDVFVRNMPIEKPFDALNQAKGKRVFVELKNGKKFSGRLMAFDIHINVVLEDVEEFENDNVKRKFNRIFIRGDTILYIIPSE